MIWVEIIDSSGREDRDVVLFSETKLLEVGELDSVIIREAKDNLGGVDFTVNEESR